MKLSFPVKKRSLKTLKELDVNAKVVSVLDYIVLVFRPMADVVQVVNVWIVLTQMNIKRSESL